MCHAPSSGFASPAQQRREAQQRRGTQQHERQAGRKEKQLKWTGLRHFPLKNRI